MQLSIESTLKFDKSTKFNAHVTIEFLLEPEADPENDLVWEALKAIPYALINLTKSDDPYKLTGHYQLNCASPSLLVLDVEERNQAIIKYVKDLNWLIHPMNQLVNIR